jgi:dihydroorotate dehydrogenase electron transfer subunit
MLQLDGRVVAHDALVDGLDRVSLHLPAIAARARPGQLVAIRLRALAFDALLRTPIAIAQADAGAGTITLLATAARDETPVWHRGDLVDVLGPIGGGWVLDERMRNVLLIGTPVHVGALLYVADVAARRGCNVTLLVGTTGAYPQLPAPAVPPDVEYQVAQGLDAGAAALELLDPSLLRWADALYTTLPVEMYPQLAERIRTTRMRWEDQFAQGLIVPPMACFVGICDSCLVAEARRPWRACIDGPQGDVRYFVR